MLRLTLKKALKTNRLDEFARQQEIAGVGPIDARELAHALAAAVKLHLSKGRTSRSASHGDSRGK